MRPAFHPRLVNDPFSDPGLYVPFHYERKALMFDLGDPGPLTARELLSVTHIFVSHTHMDHFIGFDPLLRVFLGRERTLFLYGPPGFFDRLEGKLSGYTWNLAHEYEHDLHLVATEVRPDQRVTRVYSFKSRFESKGEETLPFSGVAYEEPRFRVEAALLDHRIPCLAFAAQERFHVNIDKAALLDLGVPVGPWIDRFKAGLYQGQDPEEAFEVVWTDADGGNRRTFPLGELRDRIARITPGSRIVYVTDAVASPGNCDRIVALARGADSLFIEAAFLQEDEDLARRRYHLTAAQAGALAGRAGVRAFTLFHFSPRYQGRETALQEEAKEAYERECRWR